MEMIAGALAVIAVLFLLYTYNSRKNTMGMTQYDGVASNAYPISTENTNETPESLLPKDSHEKWTQLNPNGAGPFSNVALADPRQIVGINTVGSSLRIANLQERALPENPRTNVGPWNQSTVEPDNLRPPMDIGR